MPLSELLKTSSGVYQCCLSLVNCCNSNSSIIVAGSRKHTSLDANIGERLKAFAVALAVNIDSSFDCNSLSLEADSPHDYISAINSAASFSDWNFSSIIGEYNMPGVLLGNSYFEKCDKF
jgi:hypothetical protein